MNKNLEYYMSKNYRIEIVKDALEGGYAAQYPGLKGCITCAPTLDKLMTNLEDAKRVWLTAALEDSYPIPEPSKFYIIYCGLDLEEKKYNSVEELLDGEKK